MKIFLENIHYIPELRRLDLHHNEISDESGKLLPNYLTKCKKLEYLNISDNKISNRDELKSKILSNHPNKQLEVRI